MEFDGTEYNKREEPYICDHAEASCVCSKGMDGPHSPKQTRSYCFSAQRWVCDVPYTEQPESTESKLFICMRCKKRAHIVTDLVYEHDCESKVWAPVKSREEKEPKTKRMAVIWFGDVPESVGYLELYGFNTKTKRTECLCWVDSIDPERLRYGCEPKAGYTIFDDDKGFKVLDEDQVLESGDFLILDPPTKPETVEDVTQELNLLLLSSILTGFHKEKYDDLTKRLKAAKEREE